VYLVGSLGAKARYKIPSTPPTVCTTSEVLHPTVVTDGLELSGLASNGFIAKGDNGQGGATQSAGAIEANGQSLIVLCQD